MRGLNSALALLFAFAGAMAAQSLPDIGEAKIENVKLILVDDSKLPRGSLTGKSARKDRSGKITIEGAELQFTRDEGQFKLVCKLLKYDPGAKTFDCPEGFTADWPDGGLLAAPKSTVNFTAGEKLKLTAQCSGETRLRTGKEGGAPLDAKIADPNCELVFGASGATEQVSAKGPRGATIIASFAKLPSLNKGGAGGDLELRSYGEVEVRFTSRDAVAELKLTGRPQAKLVQKDRQFEATGATFLIRAISKSGKLSPSRLEVLDGASLTGEDFTASAHDIVLTEDAASRTAVLTQNAIAHLWREKESLRLRARKSATLTTPLNSPTAEVLRLFLEGAASLVGEGSKLDAKGEQIADWRVQGERIDCSRYAVAASAEVLASTRYDFDVEGSGFLPLLLMAGSDPRLQALSLSARRVKGFVLTPISSEAATTGECLLEGPDILVSARGPFHLLQSLRQALGLRPPGQKPESEEEGQVVVSALKTATVSFARKADRLVNLSASAEGEVEVRQEPLPFNDRDLVTLVGESATLRLRENQVDAAIVVPAPGDQTRATLGFDLVSCELFDLQTREGVQVATLHGPGRVTLRDPETLEFLHGSLSRLGIPNAESKPDAGWVVFAGNGVVTNSGAARTIELQRARLVFVHGGFLRPRGGQAAFDDLAELDGSDVTLIYEARGERLGAVVSEQPAVEGVVTKLLFEISGKPVLRSATDGLTARSSERISILSSETAVPRPDGKIARYESGVRLKLGNNARVEFRRAAKFFDERNSLGGFSYDGPWMLEANESLEIKVVPASPTLQNLQRLVARQRKVANWAQFIDSIDAFRATLHEIVPQLPANDRARAHAAAGKLADARDAFFEGARSDCAGNFDLGARFRAIARGLEADAFGLLGPDVALDARGGVTVQMEATRAATAPVKITLTELTLTMNALGELAALEGAGPLRISRGRYSLSGKRVWRGANGMVTLDGARFNLPVEIGVEIEGVQSISMLGGAKAGRVRVSGRGMSIKATLLRPVEKK